MQRTTLICVLVAGALLAAFLVPQANYLFAQHKERQVEEPAAGAGRYRIHQARLSNREDYTLLLDSVTGRTWVLGLSRDGTKLAWFDLGLPPTNDKVQERR